MRIHVNLPTGASAYAASSSSSSVLSSAPAPLTALTPSGELILIELQGSLETTSLSLTSSSTLGTLTFDPFRPDKPVLMISHHRLEGKFVSLVRPLAVLEKKVRVDKRVLQDMGNEEETVGSVKRAKREEPVTPKKGGREALDFSSSPPQMTPVKARTVKTTLTSVDENGIESHTAAGDELKEDSGREDDLEEEDEEADESQTAIYYDVVSIIKRKILFSKRPEPIVRLDTSPTATRTSKT